MIGDMTLFEGVLRAPKIPRTSNQALICANAVVIWDVHHKASSLGRTPVSEVFVEGTYECEYRVRVRGRALSIDLPRSMDSQTPPALSSHVPCHPFELSNLHTHEIIMKLELGSQDFSSLVCPKRHISATKAYCESGTRTTGMWGTNGVMQLRPWS